MFQREILPSNLRKLEIWNNTQLTPQVEWGLQRMTSLTNFTIKGGCEDMELFPKECLLPSSLTFLSIFNLPNLKSLHSGGLQQLTSLEELHISQCPKLQFFTEVSLQNLTSLQTLYIKDCPKLKYLTKHRLPPSLSFVSVRNCPLFEKRCQFEKGEEWPYISHVPNIVINSVLL